MSGLVGSLEAISTVFDSTDPKDIREGIKECISNEGKILSAEERKKEEQQRVTMQEKIDSAALTDEIRGDMGEGPVVNEDKEYDER